jgi:ribosomal protein S14
MPFDQRCGSCAATKNMRNVCCRSTPEIVMAAASPRGSRALLLSSHDPAARIDRSAVRGAQRSKKCGMHWQGPRALGLSRRCPRPCLTLSVSPCLRRRPTSPLRLEKRRERGARASALVRRWGRPSHVHRCSACLSPSPAPPPRQRRQCGPGCALQRAARPHRGGSRMHASAAVGGSFAAVRSPLR